MTDRIPDVPKCPSDLHLDRFRFFELTAAEHRDVETHIAQCAACRSRLDEATRADMDFGAEFAPVSRVRASAADLANGDASPEKRRSLIPLPTRIIGGATLAAAAVLFTLLPPRGVEDADSSAPVASETRTKGSLALWVHVERAGEIFEATSDDVVHSGDRLQFSVATPHSAHLALFGIDATQSVQKYFPTTSESTELARGRTELPLSITLDSVLGTERFIAVQCDQPLDLAALQKQLPNRTPHGVGCQWAELQLRKVAQ